MRNLGIFLVISVTGFSTSQEPVSPFFTSSASSESVEIGRKVLLRCQVERLGDSTLIWKKDGRMISAGERLIRKDSRMRLIDYNLEILNIKEEDAGEYICNVETFGAPLDQSHKLEVLVPPSIQSRPSDGKFVVRAGSTVTLECQARGNPLPDIMWTRQNLLLPNGDKSLSGQSLLIQNVSRHHAGLFVCVADNGVGDKARAEIDLRVLYPPEIFVDHSWIKSKGGLEAEVTCSVHAEPRASVKWYKDTMLLDQTDDRLMQTFGNKHVLLLTNMDKHDFGNYSCMADNSLGRKRKSTEVSGRPHTAMVTSPSSSMYQDQYYLTWTVDSFLRVEECRILYRVVRDKITIGHPLKSDWTTLLPAMTTDPTVGSGSDVSYSGHFTFYGLAPDTEYEVKIQTRNREGWSELSGVFPFRTRDKDSDPLEMKLKNDQHFFSSACSQNHWNLLVVFPVVVRTFQ